MNKSREAANRLNPLICDTDYTGTLHRVSCVILLLQDIAIHEVEIKDSGSWNGLFQIQDCMRAALGFELDEAERNEGGES